MISVSSASIRLNLVLKIVRSRHKYFSTAKLGKIYISSATPNTGPATDVLKNNIIKMYHQNHLFSPRLILSKKSEGVDKYLLLE